MASRPGQLAERVEYYRKSRRTGTFRTPKGVRIAVLFEKSDGREGAGDGDDKVTRRHGDMARTLGRCADWSIALLVAVAFASSPCRRVALSPCWAGAGACADQPSGAGPTAAAPRWKARNRR